MKDNILKKFIVYSVFTEILYLSFFLIEPLRKALGDQAIVLRNNYLFILSRKYLVPSNLFLYKDFSLKNEVGFSCMEEISQNVMAFSSYGIIRRRV